MRLAFQEDIGVGENREAGLDETDRRGGEALQLEVDFELVAAPRQQHIAADARGIAELRNVGAEAAGHAAVAARQMDLQVLRLPHVPGVAIIDAHGPGVDRSFGQIARLLAGIRRFQQLLHQRADHAARLRLIGRLPRAGDQRAAELEVAVLVAAQRQLGTEEIDSRRRDQAAEQCAAAQPEADFRNRSQFLPRRILDAHADAADVERALPARPGQHRILDHELEIRAGPVQRLFDVRLQEAEMDRSLICQAIGDEAGDHRDAGEQGTEHLQHDLAGAHNHRALALAPRS